MSGQNVTEIANKLNDIFKQEGRQLVFWYDKHADFLEEIDTLSTELDGKVYKLTEGGLLRAKVTLTRECPEENFLVYANFHRPNIRENPLTDLEEFSHLFQADRLSMLLSEFQLPLAYRGLLQSYERFFASGERRKRFQKLLRDNPETDDVILAMLATLARVNDVAKMEKIVTKVLLSGQIDDNPILSEFEKFGLLEKFWAYVSFEYGLKLPEQTLSQFICAMYTNYFYFLMNVPEIHFLPRLASYESEKLGNIGSLMGSLKNNMQSTERFNELAVFAYEKLHGAELLESTPLDDLVENDAFPQIDEQFMKWLTDRIFHEDKHLSVGEHSVRELVKKREALNISEQVKFHYKMLKHGWYLLDIRNVTSVGEQDGLLENYITEGYKIDLHYRKFYYYFDKLVDERKESAEALRQFLENLYRNQFLEKLNTAWTTGFCYQNFPKQLQQPQFFERFLSKRQGKVAVVISDGLRFEAMKDLEKRMSSDTRYRLNMAHMLSVLPSVTKLGKAALLPHENINLTEDYTVLVDDLSVKGTVERGKILAKSRPSSSAITFEEVMRSTSAKLREAFPIEKGEVLYIYHDRIDATGDKSLTQSSVFAATEQTIQELEKIIVKLSNSLSIQHFIITSDHGYFYKRDEITEAEKIDIRVANDDEVGHRYILSKHRYDDIEGVISLPLSEIFGNQDSRYVNMPKTTSIFKRSGGGAHYVHGGATLQEMVVPVLQVYRERGVNTSQNAKIQLIETGRTITSFFFSLGFIQSDVVGGHVLSGRYALYFESRAGERISDEQIHLANNPSASPTDRQFRLNFQIKEQVYGKQEGYYLVIYDLMKEAELERNLFYIDVAYE